MKTIAVSFLCLFFCSAHGQTSSRYSSEEWKYFQAKLELVSNGTEKDNHLTFCFQNLKYSQIIDNDCIIIDIKAAAICFAEGLEGAAQRSHEKAQHSWKCDGYEVSTSQYSKLVFVQTGIELGGIRKYTTMPPKKAIELALRVRALSEKLP